jgi:hypothetical protein
VVLNLKQLKKAGKTCLNKMLVFYWLDLSILQLHLPMGKFLEHVFHLGKPN